MNENSKYSLLIIKIPYKPLSWTIHYTTLVFPVIINLIQQINTFLMIIFFESQLGRYNCHLKVTFSCIVDNVNSFISSICDHQ